MAPHKKTPTGTKRTKVPATQSSPEANAQQVYEIVRVALHLARSKTVAAVNAAMVEAYWEIGRKIAEAVGNRAEYGKRLLHFLSGQLTTEFGKGFTPRNLWHMRQFYEAFPNMHALRAQLSWTHYRTAFPAFVGSRPQRGDDVGTPVKKSPPRFSCRPQPGARASCPHSYADETPRAQKPTVAP